MPPDKNQTDYIQILKDNCYQLFQMVAALDNNLMVAAEHLRAEDFPKDLRPAWEATLDWWYGEKPFNLDSYARVKMAVDIHTFQDAIALQPKAPTTNRQVRAICDVIQDAARRLRLAKTGNELSVEAYTAEDVGELEQRAGDRILHNAPLALSLPDRKESTAAVIAIVKDYHDNPAEIRGMQGSEEFYPVDLIMDGCHSGEYIILTGRPSMGKSTLMSQYTPGLAANGYGGIVFSFEMNEYSFRRKAACALSRTDAKRLKQGRLSETELHTFNTTMIRLEKLPWWVVDTPGLTIADMGAIARIAQRDHGIKWIVIDTLNKVGDIAQFGEPYTGMTHASNRVAALALKLGITVIAVAQMNRANTMQQNKRPSLSQLRDSGALEQDADKVVSVHRPWYYDQTDPTWENVAEIAVLKNRDDMLGVSELGWDAAWPGFYRIERETVDVDALLPNWRE
jgi:replicative DNA helicase